MASTHRDQPTSPCEACDDAPLTDGQRRRVRLLESIEGDVCERIGRLCTTSALAVSDVAVVIVDAPARRLLFDVWDSSDREPAVMVGSRQDIHHFLAAMLPAAPETTADPFSDLREPAPAGCARVVVIDETSVTILSYGSFVLVRVEGDRIPQA